MQQKWFKLITFMFSLSFQVRDLVEKCTCPSQFPMIRVSEGKYRIGDTKVLIFVRVSLIANLSSLWAVYDLWPFEQYESPILCKCFAACCSLGPRDHRFERKLMAGFGKIVIYVFHLSKSLFTRGKTNKQHFLYRVKRRLEAPRDEIIAVRYWSACCLCFHCSVDSLQ